MRGGVRGGVLALCVGVSCAGWSAAQNLVVYDNGLAEGWSDWSYPSPGIAVNFSNPSPVHSAGASIAVTFNGPSAALSLRTTPALDTSVYSSIRFWVFGGAGGTGLRAFTQSTDSGAGSPVFAFTAAAGVWTQIDVPLSALGSPSQIARINVQDSTGTTQPTFYVDDVELVVEEFEGPHAGSREPLADRVLGQAAFNAAGAGTSATTLNGPAALAVGPDGRLFVVDYENSRVLGWPSARDFTNGAAATLVLGQANFTTSTPGTATNKFDHPEGVTVDPQGNVFVADTGNHRIMVFSPPLSNGMTRTLGWGSQNCGSTALDVLCFPRALASDPSGNIYLADEFHNRVLIYQTPLTTNTTPDKVLDNLLGVRGVAVDSAGNVFASDSDSDVVREYDTPLAGDTSADRVYGTVSDGLDCFNSAVAAPTPTSLACPIDLTVDATGNLYVSDLYHNRVLTYLNPLGDSVPDVVFGQRGSFTVGTPNTNGLSAESIRTPLGLAFDSHGSLYLADFDNNRVLAYDGVKGDFTKDSKVDLVFHSASTNRNMLWSMDGVNQAGATWITPDPTGTAWQIVGVDDFNRDNNADLVLWNNLTGAVEFWLMNDANRTGDPVPLSGAAPLDLSWKLAATGDFNFDGRPDLLWRNSVSQLLTLWTMNGTARVGTLTPTPDHAVDNNWEVVATIDYNRDGNRDLLWYNYTSGKIVLWLMNASVVRTTGMFTNPANAGDNNWKVYAGGDFGIGAGGLFGTNDIVWRNATSGRVVTWYMDTAGNRTTGVFTSPDGPMNDPDGTPTPATDWLLVGPH